MDWRPIIEFINARDPGFAERVHGASPERLIEVQHMHPVPLPRSYASYLSTFGEYDGGFTLSDERFTSVGALLDEFHAAPEPRPRPSFPTDRFLWIAGQLDERDHSYWGDFYLDLAAGDRDDPPLVAHDFIEPYDPEDKPYVISPRFSEYVQLEAYRSYEESRRPFALTLSLGFPRRRLAEAWSSVVALLQKAGFQPVLPGGPTLWVGARGDDSVSICVRVFEALITLLIVGDRQEDCAYVGELIRDNIAADYVNLRTDD